MLPSVCSFRSYRPCFPSVHTFTSLRQFVRIWRNFVVSHVPDRVLWFSHPWAFLKVLRTYEGSAMDRPEVVATAAVGMFAYLHFVMPPAVHPINSNRNKTGEFHTLVKQLMSFGPTLPYTYFRMTRLSVYIMYYGIDAIAVMRAHMSNSVEDHIACQWAHDVAITSLFTIKLRKDVICTK